MAILGSDFDPVRLIDLQANDAEDNDQQPKGEDVCNAQSKAKDHAQNSQPK